MSSELFRVEPHASANIIHLRLPQSLDAVEFDRLNEALLKFFDGTTGGKWIVDLTDVAYMGSAMLGLMVNVRQRVKTAGGRLVLCAMPSSLLQIFKTCSLERLFTIVKTRADALGAGY